MPNHKTGINLPQFSIDLEMLPANDLIFCDMFENVSLFERVIQSVVGKSERVELKEAPLSQVAYTNPRLSAEKKARLGTIRVDVQAEGEQKLFSLDMQQKYNESVILKRVVFYTFRIYTSQTVTNMRYDKLKPACVTFIMTESPVGEKHEIQKLTLLNETTGRKYYDIVDSYLVFVPAVIKNHKNKNDDLLVFSSFFAITDQARADMFAQNYGNRLLGKELIRMYTDAVKRKIRLLGIKQHNYYFTEKEYEHSKLEDDEKHAQEILLITKELQESEKQRQESEKQRLEAEKQRLEAEKQRQEAEKQAKNQLLEAAVKFVKGGMDITAVSENMNIPVPEIEDFIVKSKQNLVT